MTNQIMENHCFQCGEAHPDYDDPVLALAGMVRQQQDLIEQLSSIVSEKTTSFEDNALWQAYRKIQDDAGHLLYHIEKRA